MRKLRLLSISAVVAGLVLAMGALSLDVATRVLAVAEHTARSAR